MTSGAGVLGMSYDEASARARARALHMPEDAWPACSFDKYEAAARAVALAAHTGRYPDCFVVAAGAAAAVHVPMEAVTPAPAQPAQPAPYEPEEEDEMPRWHNAFDDNTLMVAALDAAEADMAARQRQQQQRPRAESPPLARRVHVRTAAPQ